MFFFYFYNARLRSCWKYILKQRWDWTNIECSLMSSNSHTWSRSLLETRHFILKITEKMSPESIVWCNCLPPNFRYNWTVSKGIIFMTLWAFPHLISLYHNLEIWVNTLFSHVQHSFIHSLEKLWKPHPWISYILPFLSGKGKGVYIFK